MSVRVYIFEDSFIDLTALEAILRDVQDTEVVGSGKMVNQAVEDCLKLRPRLIIADSDIDGEKMAGVRFVRAIREQLPDVKILGITKHQDCIEPLRRAGCNHVADKALIHSREEAARYIREALKAYPALMGEIVPPTLTDTQDRVLRLIAAGLTEEEIVDHMGFSGRKPLVNAKKQLTDAFGSTNLPNLIDHAYRSGYLNPKRTD